MLNQNMKNLNFWIISVKINQFIVYGGLEKAGATIC